MIYDIYYYFNQILIFVKNNLIIIVIDNYLMYYIRYHLLLILIYLMYPDIVELILLAYILLLGIFLVEFYGKFYASLFIIIIYVYYIQNIDCNNSVNFYTIFISFINRFITLSN